jgi:acyl dehydratase
MREVSGVGVSAHVLTKRVLFDKMLVFSGYPETNSVHTNRELARSLGLPDAIGQGLQTYGYMCEWLVDYFGEDWYKGGRLIVSFLSLVVPGDTLYVKASEEETQEVDEGDHIVLAIWCENASGQKVAAGTASATIHHKR